MFNPNQYQLLDFGEGRRLERFCELVLDRPSPAAEQDRRSNPSLWNMADARFVLSNDGNKSIGERGIWCPLTEKGHFYFPAKPKDNKVFPSWLIHHDHASFDLELKGSPFGHLGVFPEQSVHWDYFYDYAISFEREMKRPARILNLFAYTGGSTMAVAAGHAEVVHVDSARNIVQLGKKNVEKSFTTPPSIRWIVEDAVKYVRREKQRGHRYDGIILDPPSYGHGASGEVWRLTRDLPPLIDSLCTLLEKRHSRFLLTCHLVGSELVTVQETLINIFEKYFSSYNDNKRNLQSSPMSLTASNGRKMPAGHRFLYEIN